MSWLQDLLAEAVAQAAEVYPPCSTSAELLASGTPKNHWSYPFDGNQMMAFNDLPLTPGLMKACAQCLGHEDLRLIKAGFNLKTADFAVRGGEMEGPQMLQSHQTGSGETFAIGAEPHSQEYGRTTLAVPPLDSIEAVAAVIFLNDIHDVGGAWCVVPHTAGADGWARSIISGKDSADTPPLEKHERATDYKAGTVLLYRSEISKNFPFVGMLQLTLLNGDVLHRHDARFALISVDGTGWTPTVARHQSSQGGGNSL